MGRFFKGCFALIIISAALIFVFALVLSDKNAATRIASKTPVYAVPSEESQFIDDIQSAHRTSQLAENDMQKGGIKDRRDRALCAIITTLNRHVDSWVGTVKTIDSNSDGLGVLAVELEEGVTLKTWNNGFSDIASNTLLKPDSQVFQDASVLKPGQKVDISGDFPIDQLGGDCLPESSMTLDGKLNEPEFIFRFSEIGPARTASEHKTISSAPRPPDHAIEQPREEVAQVSPAAQGSIESEENIPALATIQRRVIAKGGKFVTDGAMVCPSADALDRMDQAVRDGLKAGSRNVDMDASCDVVPAGTPMVAIANGRTIHVKAVLNGKAVIGETFPEMVAPRGPTLD